jgi:putative ABC transport system permease protein
MERRLLAASLLRRRGAVGLAMLAIAIGASVASALLHVSGDISRRLANELRALGPNVLVLPPSTSDAAARDTRSFLDERAVGAALARSGLHGAPVLYAVVRANGEPVTLAGTDLAAARALHPQWRIGAGDQRSLVGREVARRLGLQPGEPLDVELPDGSHATLGAGAVLDAGGADDEAWWLPIERVQQLTRLDGRASLFQGRVEGGTEAVARWRTRLAPSVSGMGVNVVPIGALSSTESELLHRMRRLMALVTIAALVAALLCALGTLTDRALERRRDFALLQALGGSRARILGQFALEAAAIGLAGGLAGFLLGLAMAQVIGHQVFHTGIAPRLSVAPVVVGLALLVAAASSIGPARQALAVAPAQALKED